MSTSSLDSSNTTSTSSNQTQSQSSNHYEIISILEPIGYSTSNCGYCKQKNGERTKGNKSYGLWSHILSVQTYKQLIDQGWRRSGKYLYKPDMRKTCCPQYTISLQVASFNPSKSQKQLLKKFNSYVINGGREGQIGWGRSEGDPEPTLTQTDDIVPTTSTTTPFTIKKKEMIKIDSQLSSSVAVNYHPIAEPGNLNEDENNQDFLIPSTSTSSHIGVLSDKNNNKRSKKSHISAESTTSKQDTGNAGKGMNSKSKGKGKESKNDNTAPETLDDLLHSAEWKNSPKENPFKHCFEYSEEPASYTVEKYELFREYQTKIHGEEDSKVTIKGFRRFLVDTPLKPEPSSSLPASTINTSPSTSNSNAQSTTMYGSHHALYRLDGILIAFAVLDILPPCTNEGTDDNIKGPVVSSVYFVWSPKWSGMSLGKISALREAGMVSDLEKIEGKDCGFGRYMMGFYIHTCPKMKYKADYQPSSLLDPETNQYFPWTVCKPLLDQNPHTSFSNPSSSAKFISPAVASVVISPKPILSTPTTSTIAQSKSESKSLQTTTRSNTDTFDSDTSETEDEDEDDDTNEEEENEEDRKWPNPSPPGCLDPLNLPKNLILGSYLLEGKSLVPLMFSKTWHNQEKAKMIRECLAALGTNTIGKVALWMG